MMPLSNTHKVLLLLSSLFLINCCKPMVGGECKYEVHQGIATVVGIKDGHVLARFTSTQPFTKAEWHRMSSRYYLYGIQHADIGDSFPARLSIIYQGSCTPMRLSIVRQP